MRLDHVASRIAHANHGIATESASLCAPMKS
jgi:phage tail protein X